MLSELIRIMGRELPALLVEPSTPWSTMDVTYEDPHVERLWLQLGEYRVNLHRIHPCAKPLVHTHPWPSAVYVLTGEYRMGVGQFGSDSPSATVLLRAGSAYEMLDPTGWHYVQPLERPSFSVMLTGRPWDAGGIKQAGKGHRHGPLSDHVREGMVTVFRDLLRDWPHSPHSSHPPRA